MYLEAEETQLPYSSVASLSPLSLLTPWGDGLWISVTEEERPPRAPVLCIVSTSRVGTPSLSLISHKESF